VPAGPTLLYSYWRGGQTLAALRWAQGHAGGRVVTRVHGYDLYAEAFRPPFQPWTALYARVDRVLAISRHGADYLLGHGVAPGRVTLARLGVSGADVRACASDDGVWRVVSCSNVIALKRVDRIARALVLLARRRPAQRLAWTHFGAGPEMPAVQAALQGAPVNLEVALAGQVPNETVRAHYAGHPVDLFVLLSRTEGLPVSIQEALAAGIPVLATDVGGVAEAVDRNGDNGALVAADAPDDVVADALERLLAEPDPTRAAARRDAAWQRWAEAFDARRNHQRLAEQLQALLAPAR
jgi:glycosyltransferase involved in cell wall biosynthesis